MKRRNAIELVAGAVMPFMSFAVLTLAKLVSINFAVPDSSFWVDVVVNTFVLLSFFIPFKSIFKEKFLNGERILDKEKEYAGFVAEIYDGKLKQFSTWTEEELEERRKKYITQNLQLTTVNYDSFVDKYKMSKKLVKGDKSLSAEEQKTIASIIKGLPKIKQIRTDDCLPGANSNTIFNRLATKAEKVDRYITVAKVTRSLVVCAGVAMLSYSFNKEANVLEILTDLGIKLLLGVWHVFAASRVADKLVSKIYFQELSEKSLVIQEFLEEKKNKQVIQ